MPIAASIAGRFGSAMWSANPLLGLGLAFGTGAGAYAGLHTFAATDGSFSDKAAAARTSSLKYLAFGTLGMTGGLTAATYMPNSAAGRFVGSTFRGIPIAASNYARGIRSDFAVGGFSRVAERKSLMTGAGAAIGALIGHHLDQDDPEHGAKVGAVAGGGMGLAVSSGMRASRIWKKIGPAGRLGFLGALSVAAFGATATMSGSKYQTVDQAVREDNGLHRRMNSMNATGDLALGLHNRR